MAEWNDHPDYVAMTEGAMIPGGIGSFG